MDAFLSFSEFLHGYANRSMGPKGKSPYIRTIRSATAHWHFWIDNCYAFQTKMVSRHIIVSCVLILTGCGRSPQELYTHHLQKGKESYAQKDYLAANVHFRNAVKALPRESEGHYQLARAALGIGDTQSAVESLKQSIGCNPKHLDAVLALADLYARSLHKATMDEGRRLAKTALAFSPENTKAENLLALLDLRSNDIKQAAARLEDLLKRHPDNSEALINLARVRVSQRNLQGAEGLLRRAAATTPADATAIFALADFYNMRGEVQEAVESYGRGLQIQPDHAPATAALARLHAKLGRKQEAAALFARATHNPDRRFRYLHADYLLESGQKDEAIAEFANIQRRNPSDRDSRTRLINAYLVSGRTKEAEDLLTQALSRNTKDTDALLQRARINLSRGMPDAAQNDLRLVLDYQGDSAEAHYLIAQVHRFHKREALQQQELSESLRLNENYLLARIDLSRLLVNKDPGRALMILDGAPVEQRENAELQVQRIWPLLELNRTEEAREWISRWIGSGNSEVLLQDAVLRMRQRDFDGAVLSAQKVLASNPEDVRALELILRSYAGEKRMTDGLAFARKHASDHPGISGIQLLLGRLEMLAGNTDKARAALELAKRANPQSAEADWGLIDLDLAEGKWDEARRRITPLLSGSSKVAAIGKLALIEQRAGNYLAASQHYEKVIESDPRAWFALNNLAYILAEFLGKPTEALRFAQEAKEIAPQNAGVDDTLGWTYYQMGLYPSAVRHLEMAVKRDPTASRRAHLAMAYAKNGNKVRAREMLESATRMNPMSPETSVAERVLAGQ